MSIILTVNALEFHLFCDDENFHVKLEHVDLEFKIHLYDLISIIGCHISTIQHKLEKFQILAEPKKASFPLKLPISRFDPESETWSMKIFFEMNPK